ncbi:MAG: HEAT repeat domain-containing protein [Planctomycetes bacterium]|nr:HEAT repeat domain-containing protein [Planctomycetota bacterium]
MLLRAANILALGLVSTTWAPAQGKPPAKPGAQAATPQDPAAADTAALQSWLGQYQKGAIRLVREDKVDADAVAQVDQLLAAVAKANTLAAARALFAAAAVEPRPVGTANSVELIDFHRELQPWRVQALAAQHLRTMTGDGIVPWLCGMLSAPGLRSAKAGPEFAQAAAALRVLGGHPSAEAQLELLRAAHTMPVELRVRAVNALAVDAQLELIPTLLGLLRDTEPNVRIAAANAIGTALQPHVDETAGKNPEGTALQLRDQAIAKLDEVLLRETVWQVRSAAAYALAVMKCKAAIPALIRGLDAELQRKKDPWAMDVRLHRLLEGLTGQSVVRGSIAPWQEFWSREGPSFRVRPTPAPGTAPAAANKYEKFFNLEIESDRVLFVLDFSGSMAEPVQVQSGTTSAGGGETITKAQLVVRELKKLIMSLPDGALINLVVFSSDVRIWRLDGGRPALVKLDDAARDDLLGTFLDSLRPNGPTNLYDALDKALDFGGRGLHDKYYAAGFDTLYVITDGAPTAGPVVDKAEIRRRVREANNLRKVSIHCITFGDKNDTDFLRPMAEENGGRHIHIE